ncbi:MAG: AI-2E family transporter [Gemmatimonadales bacterium]
MRLFDSKHQRAAAMILILGVAIVVALLPFSTGLIGILVLYVLFSPLYELLAPRIRPGIAASLVVALALFLILVTASLLTGIVVDQAPQIAREIARGPILQRVADLHIGRVDVGSELAKMGEQAVQFLGTSALGLIGTATRFVLNMLISLFGLFYLLIHSGETWGSIEPYIPFPRANIAVLRDRFRDVTKSTIIGTGLTAVIQGVLTGIGFWVTGLPHETFWGLVTLIFAILPVVGGGLVWGPGALFLALDGRYGAAAGLLTLGIVVVTNVEYVIRPWVYRRWAKIHPLVTLVGAFAGIRFFGLLGLLVGPLALSYFFELIRMYREEYIRGEKRRAK